MSMQYLRPYLVIACLTGVGGSLLAFGLNHARTQQLLDQGAAVIEGKVIEASTRALAKGGQSSTLVVEYAPMNSKPITRNFDVDGDTYRAALESGRASVTYLPGRPEISRVTRFAIVPFQILAGFGGLVLLAGLFCLGHLIHTRRKARTA
jgi:hypothetical protein